MEQTFDNDLTPPSRYLIELGIVILFFAGAIGVNFFFFHEFNRPRNPVVLTQLRPVVKSAHVRASPTPTTRPSPTPDLKQKIPHLGIKIRVADGWLFPQITPPPSTTSATITNAVYSLVIAQDPVATGSPKLLPLPGNTARTDIIIAQHSFAKETYVINRSIVPNDYPVKSVEDIKYPPDLPLGEYFNGAVYFTQNSPTTRTLGVEIADIYPHTLRLGISYVIAPEYLPTIDHERPDIKTSQKYKALDLNSEVYQQAVADMDSMVSSIAPLTP